jgi:ABC-type branched-subunit amino acid transport system substrate-binding protein
MASPRFLQEDEGERPVLTLTSCGIDTVLDPTTNQCLCPSAIPDQGPDEDPSVIYIGGIYDTTNYEWAPDIFEVTVRLLNQGWWDALPQDQDAVTLVYTLLNSNCDETTAVRSYWDLRTANGNVPPHGLIGARCSGPSIQLARIAGLEGVPQVSPASNSAKLSNEAAFPFFSRMVAPNNENGEVGALVATMRSFGWERITILATDTQFSKDLVTEFRKLWVGPHDDESGQWIGSIAYSDEIRVGDDKVDEESLEQVLANVPVNDPANNSRIIMMVAHSQHAFRILKHAADTDFQPDTVWVGPSAWAGRSDSDMREDTGFEWLPQLPGYLGVAPYRNRDQNYRSFLSALQQFQAEQGKVVSYELPPFAAETVDSIVALTKAIASTTSSRRDGSAIVENLRQLDFGGVSGRVQFTPSGDRKDPLFSIYNSQSGAVGGDITWTEVGASGTEIGSVLLANPDESFAEICFAKVGCGLDMVPDDTYPEDPSKLPVWVSVAISVLGLLFILMAFKYWRSRRSKKSIKAELQAFQKSIVGMRAALCDYVPKVSEAKGDVEEAAITNVVKVVPQKVVQWCWQESAGCMDQHDDTNIHGDAANYLIKYDSVTASELERAFQSKQKYFSFIAGGYQVDFGKMQQTKLSTGFSRDVVRFEETNKDEQTKEVDLTQAMFGGVMPADLVGEPQMVLVEGDIVQITTQRDDGWAFGTKVRHFYSRRVAKK